VLVNALGTTDTQGGGVNEADACAGAELRVEIDGQGDHDPWHEGDEAGVADQLRELSAQMALDVLGVVALEGAVARLLEQDQDRHDLAGMQPRCTAATATGRHLLPLPPRRKLLPERIHRVEQVEYTHEQCLQS